MHLKRDLKTKAESASTRSAYHNMRFDGRLVDLFFSLTETISLFQREISQYFNFAEKEFYETKGSSMS
jgi:hypothetical protein